jgi:drug/metabolite transporter (DMT)-like permease
LLRDVIGFFGGGIVAAVAAALVFQVFFPLPAEPKPTDHTGEALAILVLVVFFCGGFIGRRAFSADFWSDLLPSTITSYIVMVFLCLTASLDFRETATMLAFASAGIAVSTGLLILLGRRFPAKIESYEV